MMSVFGNIMSGIFGKSGQAHAAQPTPAAPTSATTSQTTAAPTQASGSAAPAQSTASSGLATGASTGSAGSGQPVDVAAVLAGLAAQKKEKLDWRHSIVDLMKVLDLDSSLSARKELAHELKYSGDTGDSASMNVWLHKQVTVKLAENGGQVPDGLKEA